MVRWQRKPGNNWSLNLWPLLVPGIVALCALFPALQQQHGAQIIAHAPANKLQATDIPPVGFGVDQTRVESPAQDATGDIWAIQPWTTDAFFKWNGTAWLQQSFEPAKGYSPIALQRVQDGAVLCLWQHIEKNNATKDFLLSEHRGSANRVLARWRGDEEGWCRLFRSPRATWITFWGTQIYRVENETATRVYEIQPAQMQVASSSPPSHWQGNNPLEMLEDARGHTWFWSNEFEGNPSNLSLRGLLEYDGGKWIHHTHLQGLPDKPLTALAMRDANSFWLAVGDVGLFEFDVETLTGQRIADPLPRAFEQVQTIRQVGDQWYVIANAPEVISPGDDSFRRQSDVWRWHATSAPAPEGHFERVLRGLDYGRDVSDRPNRPLLGTDSGLWLGALSGGAWWLPSDTTQAPVHIDWRRGLLLADVNALFQQSDGSVMASSKSGTVPDLRPYLRVAPAKSPQTFTVYNNLIEDARHHLWRVPNLKAKVVQEWDGTHWTSYAIPTAYRISSLFYLSADTRGRIWFLPASKDGPTALLSPSTGSWQCFPTFFQALQNQLKRFGAAGFAGLKIGSGMYQVPRVFAPTRLAFRSPDDELCYFDGQQWRIWGIEDIVGGKPRVTPAWEETPYFDAVGNLCANIDAETWQWTRATDWTARKFVPYPFATPEPPANATSSHQATIRDSSGAIWTLKNRQLWKAAWGLYEPQLAPGEFHPVRDGRALEGVYLDPRGVPLLATEKGGHREYVWTSDVPPDTRVNVTAKTLDTFNLRLLALPQNQEKHWFRWRLDAGQWSKPQTDPTLLLSLPSPGAHRFEVAAINGHLLLDQSPATLTLRVPVMSRKRLLRLLSLLGSPNYSERESAVQAFSRQPAVSIPFLRDARRTANPDLQWWIEASLQEIERHKNSP